LSRKSVNHGQKSFIKLAPGWDRKLDLCHDQPGSGFGLGVRRPRAPDRTLRRTETVQNRKDRTRQVVLQFSGETQSGKWQWDLIPMFVERKVHYSALLTNLVGWHKSAVSLPLSDITLAQLACPLSDVMFCLHSGILNLFLYKHWLILAKKRECLPVAKLTAEHIFKNKARASLAYKTLQNFCNHWPPCHFKIS